MEQCPTKPQKRGGRVLRTAEKAYSTTKQRDKIEQPGYKEIGDRRTAVGGVCSSLKDRFRAGQMKVRGKKGVTRAMSAKGLAYH